MSRTERRWSPEPRWLLGALGVGVAAAALVWAGPLWAAFVAVALGSVYVAGAAPLAVAFGQIALVAVDPASTAAAVTVEVGLFLALVAAALSAPTPSAAAAVTAAVPLFAGLTWLALSSWQLDPMAVALVLGCGFATAAYLLHRYLLVSLGIVSRNHPQSSPTHE